jgi:serine/threonine-protein kinase
LTVEPNDLPRPFGDFTLLRLIAQGGMGAVFLSLRPVEVEESRMRHLPEGQEEVCVVKTVRSDLQADREALGRFLDEARVVQKLTHPRIARTLDAGVIDKTYFLALEFISGRNLRDVHTRAQKLGVALPEPLIVHVVSEMLEALDYAHKLKDPDNGQPLNIVHRDVSPHNVMLGFDGNTRLIDFGLAAHELKRELTRPGVMVGKLRYNAPEQVRDRALDGRSDVYSAAVVLYEFIANERFYEGLPEEQVWRVAMKGDHRPRSWRDIDIEWRHLLDVALQNDPEKRYRDAREFRMALLDVAESKGIDLGRMRKAAKRFMAEIFEREQVQEREMILQATGIAEARTQLFRSPSELQSAINNIAPQHSDVDVPEMRTEILDTNAAHLVELRNMMSHLAAPDDETALPSDPISAAASADASILSVDSDAIVGDGASLSAAAKSASDARLSGRNTRVTPAYDDSSDDSDDDGDPRYSRVDNDDDVPQPTVASRGRARLGAQRQSASSDGQHDDGRDTVDGDNDTHEAIAPEPNPGTASLARRRRADPLPPLAPKAGAKASHPLLALGLGLLAVVVVGVAAILAIPHLLKPQADLIAPVGSVPIAIGDDALVADAGSVVDVVVDAGAAGNAAVVVVMGNAADAGSDSADEDEGADEDEDAVDEDDDDKDVPKIRRPPRRKPTSTKPPKTVPTSITGQLSYLKQHCVGRVQCAKSLVTDGNNFQALSAADVRDLKEALPKCIDRCQRQ